MHDSPASSLAAGRQRARPVRSTTLPTGVGRTSDVRSIQTFDISAHSLFLTLATLVLQPFTRDRSGDSGSFPMFGWFRSRLNHRPQLFVAIGDVSRLLAISLAGNDQLTFVGNPVFLLIAQTLNHCRGKGPVLPYFPSQENLGIDLVDILSARPRRPRMGNLQFRFRNLKTIGHAEHGRNGKPSMQPTRLTTRSRSPMVRSEPTPSRT